jgi:hypothetical protein
MTIRTLLFGYLLWQQLSVQPVLQQVCPHFAWQQALQYMAFEKAEVWAKAVAARTTASESEAMMRFMEISLTLELR